jgi:hypothetical protein
LKTSFIVGVADLDEPCPDDANAIEAFVKHFDILCVYIYLYPCTLNY